MAYGAILITFQLTPSRRATPSSRPISHNFSISTHALTEGDDDARSATVVFPISTHALTEGDSCFFSKIFFEIYFNSRPHGGRRLSRNSPIVLVYFNSRPHGGRLQPVADQIHLKNFNSRPHGGRREKSVNFPVWLISTHALTEGDVFVAFFRQLRDIFQLTPSRRATFPLAPKMVGLFNFNSRPHGGRRLQYCKRPIRGCIEISGCCM